MERIVRSATQGPSQRTQPRERRRSRVNRKSRESRQPPVLPEQGQNDQNYQTLYSSACPCSEKDTEERFDSRGGERSRLIQRFRDASVTWTWRRLDALSLPPQCPTPKLATHSTLAWREKCPQFWWADISFIRSVCIRLDTSATWREWTRGRVRKKRRISFCRITAAVHSRGFRTIIWRWLCIRPHKKAVVNAKGTRWAGSAYASVSVALMDSKGLNVRFRH